MNVSVIGCGRWGSLIAWYLDRIGHAVTLIGRRESPHMRRFLEERKNDLLELPESVRLSTDTADTISADVIVISVQSQQLRGLLETLRAYELKNKTFVLCMKGLEIETGKRLSDVAEELTDASNRVAVWIGPGHVQEFYAGVPNCMVIDSADPETKRQLVQAFAGPLIRFYYGNDLIGNEIGAAAKNVIGIAAGILDGLKLSTLKGALMSRGTREIARLIERMGGNPFSAYGLCHLGDYEATLFSPYSHNRAYGEALARGETFGKTAEGVATADALHRMAEKYAVELPICAAVYDVIYRNVAPKDAVDALFARSLKEEFWNANL